LLLCGADGFAEGSLNLDLVSTDSREKHSAKPVQFGTPPVANPVGELATFNIRWLGRT
jgi:hypothetical protein